MGDVVILPCETSLPLPPDRVLDGAKGKLDDVFVIGWAGNELYLACSGTDRRDLLWLLEKAKKEIL